MNVPVEYDYKVGRRKINPDLLSRKENLILGEAGITKSQSLREGVLSGISNKLLPGFPQNCGKTKNLGSKVSWKDVVLGSKTTTKGND